MLCKTPICVGTKYAERMRRRILGIFVHMLQLTGHIIAHNWHTDLVSNTLFFVIIQFISGKKQQKTINGQSRTLSQCGCRQGET